MSNYLQYKTMDGINDQYRNLIQTMLVKGAFGCPIAQIFDNNFIFLVVLAIRHDPLRYTSLIARFMGPTWGPSGAGRTQVGPMLVPWTLLSVICLLIPLEFGSEGRQTGQIRVIICTIWTMVLVEDINFLKYNIRWWFSICCPQLRR